MPTHIALLRGINVGGHNSLPMTELVAVLEGLGCENIRTVIQSGNVVLQSAGRSPSKLAKQIRLGIKESQGFEPRLLVMSRKEFAKAIEANPFPQAVADPKTLHLGFLEESPPAPDLAKLNGIQSNSERFELIDRVFYLHAPDGIGRSKLAANAEKHLGVAMTMRNWRTVSRLRDLAEE